MKKGGTGGARTVTGRAFEKKSDFLTILQAAPGYSIRKGDEGYEILLDGEVVAFSYRQTTLYKVLKKRGVDIKKVVSATLRPDEAIYSLKTNKVYVVEMKFQRRSGSVDEKLQTCDFKKKQYAKIFGALDLKVEFMYVLSPWFQVDRYRDVLNYINTVGCHYYFGFPPLKAIGLTDTEDRVK